MGQVLLPREGKNRFALPRMRNHRKSGTQDLKSQMQQRVWATGCASTLACLAAFGQMSSQEQTKPIRGETGRILYPGGDLTCSVFSLHLYGDALGPVFSLITDERLHGWVWGCSTRGSALHSQDAHCRPAWGSAPAQIRFLFKERIVRCAD